MLLDKPTYLDLVREFYMNLRLGDSGLFAIVKNALIQVDPDTIYEELKIPLIANSDTVPSRRTCLTTIIKNENLDFERDYLVKEFTSQIRLLHHMINMIFFPKVGRLDFVG